MSLTQIQENLASQHQSVGPDFSTVRVRQSHRIESLLSRTPMIYAFEASGNLQIVQPPYTNLISSLNWMFTKPMVFCVMSLLACTVYLFPLLKSSLKTTLLLLDIVWAILSAYLTSRIPAFVLYSDINVNKIHRKEIEGARIWSIYKKDFSYNMNLGGSKFPLDPQVFRDYQAELTGQMGYQDSLAYVTWWHTMELVFQ